jgi:hypothetical protein
VFLKYEKLKINTLVSIKSSLKIKKIIDRETICGQNIFYMDDGTSYHEKQLSSSPNDIKLSLVERLKSDNKKCEEIYNEIVKEIVSKSLSFIKKNQYYQT